MENRRYDLIVIGSGPAGEKGAAQAAYFGKKVALIEKETLLGGAAVHSGASSKSMRETALCFTGYKRRDLHGLIFTLQDTLSFQDFVRRSGNVMEQQRSRIHHNLQRHGVDLYCGSSRFIDPHTVSVDSVACEPVQLHGDVILIASGSKPHHPPYFPLDQPLVVDSNQILQLQHIPRTMIVIGGGTIACEYACVFAALGVKITLIYHGRLLNFLDHEVSYALMEQMKEHGIECLIPEEIYEITSTASDVTVILHSGQRVTAEFALVAAGRDGNTASLGLEAIGIHPTARGHIEVNERYQTTVPHIYAAGDVIGFPGMASTSMEQARVAMVHAFDLQYKKNVASVLPLAVYTIPECSMAGETEESLQQKGIPYIIGKEFYRNNSRGEIIGEKSGFLKLLFHPDDMTLLGVHIFGENAADLVHLGLTAILNKSKVDLFIQTCYNYPTLSELYKYASYDALGRRQRGEIHRLNPASA